MKERNSMFNQQTSKLYLVKVKIKGPRGKMNNYTGLRQMAALIRTITKWKKCMEFRATKKMGFQQCTSGKSAHESKQRRSIVYYTKK